jgi:hypothetical protein
MRAAVAAVFVTAMLAVPATAIASPKAPTEGGNGSGSSGQCTGSPDGRPSACWSEGGPGNKP